MPAGPLFRREVLVAPRALKHFLLRAGYVFALFVLMYTAGQTSFGWQELRDVGDAARFGKFLFELFAVIQLTLVVAASLLLASGSVSQEKDRRTLVLLLMTDLSDVELVLGKLLASLLTVFVLIGVGLPVYCLIHLLGGVAVSQILWLQVVCIMAALAAGSWGLLVAFWREKTFQTLAIGMLGTVLFLGAVAGLATVVGGAAGTWIGALNPFSALRSILDPLGQQPDVQAPVVQAWPAAIMLGLLSLGLLMYTVLRVRVWNPSRWVFDQTALAADSRPDEAPAPGQGSSLAPRATSTVTEAANALPSPPRASADRLAVVSRKVHRRVWNLPVLWREVCTRAYGRKVLLIKAAYLLFAVLMALSLWRSSPDAGLLLGMISREAFGFVAVSLVAMILVNAQAVTSITSERDGQTLELVMVTEVPSKEFVLGKLGGVLFNMKEVLVVPLGFALSAATRGGLSLENAIYVILGLAVLTLFSAMLGLHQGLSYENSRQAIVHSQGTMFFLFVGIFICMMLIVEARSSYTLQIVPFLVFILGGSLGLYSSLSHKNPSPALMLSAGVLPFLTFYGITGYLIGNTLGVFLTVLFAYGLPVLAMYVPAASGYDVALGRAAERA